VNDKDGDKRNKKTEEAGKRRVNMASVLKVKGMTCHHCAMSVTKALTRLEGIRDVQVDLDKGEVRFENPGAVASIRIETAIEEAGYQVIK
jgi:copper ion binding protein